MAKTSYVLSKRIARGGMAEIYLGKAVGEDAFQRICAVKRILPHYSQDKEFVEMFRDEAHICKRLQHANIVQVYDFTEVEGSYALIMEHVDGADLRTLLSACEAARIRLSVPMALFIGACAARGLHYAHTKVDEITDQPLGIVHRDISPQNILISYEGEVKITDFGIASAEDKITETRPGVVKGKYSYMSPEQVAAKTLDARSDVFSLAIVLWECLAMKRLFAGQTEVETIRKVQNCEIPLKLTELNSDVDETLMEIVHKGLLRDRKRRYQTAASFEKAILKYLHSKYPDFTGSELGNFLKQILAKKRGETQDDIKSVLTQTDLDKKPDSMNPLRAIKDKLNEQLSQENLIQLGRKDSRDSPPASMNLAIDERHASHAGLGPETIPSSRPGARIGTQTNSRPYRNRSQPVADYRPRRSSRKSSSGIGIVPIVVAVLLIAFGYMKRDWFLDDKLHLELRVDPETVALALNGQLLKQGAYTRTPLKLHLAPGKYRLLVQRAGYRAKNIEFEGKAGSTLNPVTIHLDRDPNYDLVPVRVVATNKTYVNIDNGLVRGYAPLVAPDLRAGIVHSVSFVVNPQTSQQQAMKCSFTPIRPTRGRIFTLYITPEPGGRARCIGRVR